MIKILTILGVIVIILGFFAMRFTKHLCESNEKYLIQRRLRKASMIIGGVLAVASWPLTYFLGYPYVTGAETGRVVGLPFIVAYFDSAGRDYISSFMLPAIIGNSAFWFTVPHIIFAIYLILYHKLRNNIETA